MEPYDALDAPYDTKTAPCSPKPMDLTQIIAKMKEGPMQPHDLSDFLMELSGEYAFLASKYDIIQDSKPAMWLKLRGESTSVSETNRKWSATEVGAAEGKLKRQMKVIGILMSNIKARLRVFETEAKNQF